MRQWPRYARRFIWHFDVVNLRASSCGSSKNGSRRVLKYYYAPRCAVPARNLYLLRFISRPCKRSGWLRRVFYSRQWKGSLRVYNAGNIVKPARAMTRSIGLIIPITRVCVCMCVAIIISAFILIALEQCDDVPFKNLTHLGNSDAVSAAALEATIR